MPRRARAVQLPRSPEHQEFIDRLKEAMLSRGLTQAELARRLDVRESTVSTWFRTAAMPGGELMAQLPAALRVSGHWLLTGEGHKLGGSDQDASKVARAVRHGALLALATWRDRLNEAERHWNSVSEEDLLAVLATPDAGAPPWGR